MKLKNIKVLDLFFGYVVVVVRFNDCLFINENLILYRRGLVDLVNRKWRDGCIYSIWIMDGKIFVKMLFEGNFVRIFIENDLEYF